jgi:type II secretory pathway pseudopilin PulG
LLELMVVVVVIGILTAMILPEMKGTFDDMLLRSTGRTLISAFGLASSQAVTTHRPYQVRLDTRGGYYRIERNSNSPDASSVHASKIYYMPGAKGDLDRRIRIQLLKGEAGEPGSAPAESLYRSQSAEPRRSESDAVTFYPDGTADPGEILLRDQEGFGLALRINPITARVRVMELQRQ